MLEFGPCFPPFGRVATRDADAARLDPTRKRNTRCAKAQIRWKLPEQRLRRRARIELCGKKAAIPMQRRLHTVRNTAARLARMRSRIGVEGIGKVETLPGDGLEHLDIEAGGFGDDIARDLRERVAIRIAAGGDPAPHEILVEAFRRLAFGETALIALAPASSGCCPGVWISSASTIWPVGVETELVFGVGQDQPALGRKISRRARTAPRPAPRPFATAARSTDCRRGSDPALSGSSWPPSNALIVGVMIVVGSFWFSCRPSGKRRPYISRRPPGTSARSRSPWSRPDSRARRSRPA